MSDGAPTQQPSPDRNPDSTGDDLVQRSGVTGGSVAAERDRRPSSSIDVGEVDGRLERDAPPPAEAVGVPGDDLSQQLDVGEG